MTRPWRVAKSPRMLSLPNAPAKILEALKRRRLSLGSASLRVGVSEGRLREILEGSPPTYQERVSLGGFAARAGLTVVPEDWVTKESAPAKKPGKVAKK